MKFIIKSALLALPALALATTAFAVDLPRPIGLADSQEPGSVIVFPKFINMPPVPVEGGVLVPRTEIEVGVVCPPGVAPTASFCQEHQPVKIRFHWVCPGEENVNSNICKETDFEIVVSINGKSVFSADGTQINSNSPIVPAAPCPRGYLIGWVENLSDVPIKFDGLIGNAVIRNPAVGPISTGVSAYNAIPIQAADTNPADTLNPIALGDPADPHALIFDGKNNHYMALTGSFYGDVRFDRTTATPGPAPAVLSTTVITFLTLDVRSNKPNNSVFVPLYFFNESSRVPSTTNPDFERLLSASWNFVCWDQVQLSTIDPNLTQAFMGTRKGMVIAGAPTGSITMKDQDGAPGDDFGKEVTLIGLIETNEGPDGFLNRKYIFNTVNNSVIVETKFVPFP
jgi:hypothetical protein